MPRPKVLVFDVNETLLDLTPVKQTVGVALGGHADMIPLWFTTLLQYSLVTTVAEQYRDFGEIAAACLQMVARNRGIELSESDAKKAVAPIRSLRPHADVVPALQKLQATGYQLVTLTNSSQSAVTEQIENAGLTKYFEKLFSVETIRKYKPHVEVYRWAAGQLGVDISECMLVAAHGWDVAGAAWAGMQTAFIARSGQQMFPLGPKIPIVVPSFAELSKELEELS